jgi:uncharacterized RDD family membrane protein YckC
MSNRPEEGAAGEQRYGQQTARPDVPAQPGAPAGPPPMQQGQPTWQQGPAGPTGPNRLGPPMMITESETRVTGRRVVQYIIDAILASIVPGIASWLFDRSSGSLHGVGWVLAAVISLAAYFIYWVSIPYAYGGQTFGMKLLRLRVISKDGDKASMPQLFIRGILLIIDTLFLGLVGLITMLCSRYRQRVGDHAAGTIVVSAEYGPQI